MNSTSKYFLDEITLAPTIMMPSAEDRQKYLRDLLEQDFIIFNNQYIGFNADRISAQFQYYGKFIISDESACKIIASTIDYVIATSYKYDVGAPQNPRKRFQMIVNSSTLELHLAKFLKRRSSGLWLLNGTYEKGADFESPDGGFLEAKIYLDTKSMLDKCQAAKTDLTIFHDADVVCCYILLDNKNHWHWLYKQPNGEYLEKPEAPSYLQNKLSASLPMCKCSAGSAFQPWELQPW